MRLQRPVAFPAYEDLRDGTAGLFSGFAGYIGPVPIRSPAGDRDERSRVWGHLTSPEYFELLRIRPALGRLFDAREREFGAAPVVVLGERLWKAASGGARPSSVKPYASTVR